MRANTGAITFVAGPPARGDIVEALRRARQAILRIPHPEEPDDPFASFASEVTSSEAGWTFSVDMADAEAYPGVLEAVLAAVVEALEEHRPRPLPLASQSVQRSMKARRHQPRNPTTGRTTPPSCPKWSRCRPATRMGSPYPRAFASTRCRWARTGLDVMSSCSTSNSLSRLSGIRAPWPPKGSP